MWWKYSGIYAVTGVMLLFAAACSGGHHSSALAPDVEQSLSAGATGNACDRDASAITFISGTVRNSLTGEGIGGVTLFFSNGVGSTSTDSNGNYSKLVSPGIYTVTPAKPYFRFFPTSRRVNASYGAVGNVNFIGTRDRWTLSGTIRQPDNSPIGAVKVELKKLGNVIRIAITDSQGQFHITGVPSGDYQLIPQKPHWAFEPAMREVTVNAADVQYLNFVGRNAWVVSGYVQDPALFGIADVKVDFMQGSEAVGSVNTDTDGYYQMTPLLNGTYVITPSKPGYTFFPATRVVTITDEDMANVNFHGSHGYYIAGRARAQTDQNIINATIELNGGERSVATNARGQYFIDGLEPGTYTVSAHKTGFKFEPASKTVTISDASIDWLNFLGKGRGDWYMMAHDMQYTNRSNLAGPATGNILWTLDFPANHYIYSPAVTADGTLVVVSAIRNNSGYTLQGYLSSISPQGTVLWQKLLSPLTLSGNPVIDCAGNIYIYGYAFNSEGEPLWHNDDITEVRVDDAGQLWCKTVGTPSYIAKCGYDGQVTWVSGLNSTYPFDYRLMKDNHILMFTNWEIWKYTLESELIWEMTSSMFHDATNKYLYMIGGLIAADDGSVYAACWAEDGTFGEDPQAFKLNPDGTVAWTASAWNTGYCAIDYLGNYYYPEDSWIDAYNNDGSLKWKSQSYAMAITDINNNVYFYDYNHVAKSLDSQGNVRWTADLQDSRAYYAVIGSDNTLYMTLTSPTPGIVAIGDN